MWSEAVRLENLVRLRPCRTSKQFIQFCYFNSARAILGDASQGFPADFSPEHKVVVGHTCFENTRISSRRHATKLFFSKIILGPRGWWACYMRESFWGCGHAKWKTLFRQIHEMKNEIGNKQVRRQESIVPKSVPSVGKRITNAKKLNAVCTHMWVC